MNRSNKIGRLLRAFAGALVLGAALPAGCTDADDTLGGNLVPEDQQMNAGYAVFDGRGIDQLNPRKFVETRLFQTDSIVSSNLSNGYMGTMANDTFGMRKAGFLSQFVTHYSIPAGYFGYKPFLDSVQILLSIDGYGADTLTDQRFGVYEVISNAYLTEKPIAAGKTKRDTTFYVTFDPENTGYAGDVIGDKLFEFSIGAGNGTGPATTAITMSPTPAGRKFIARLMLQEGKYSQQGGKFDPDYSIYAQDSLEEWVDEFKGLYIKPEQGPTSAGGSTQGTIYGTKLSASGFSFYGRNRMESNPSLIADTIGMTYYFYESYADHGNVSVNSIRHDYDGAKFDIADAREVNPDGQPNEHRPENTTLYVAGMGGVISELTLSREFFNGVSELIRKENERSGKSFTSLAFSQARLSLYFTGSDYAWEQIPGSAGIDRLIEQMNAAQSRLGLYTDFKTLTPIADYAYPYEQSYDMKLPYGGYVNRSRGCYTMDVTGYLQGVWSSFVEARRTLPDGDTPREITEKEWETIEEQIEHRSIYLGPEAYGLFTDAYSVLQGERGGDNNASVRFDLTYSMIR